MSEQANNNKTILIALIVVAALLAAIVGVLVWQSNKDDGTDTTTTTTNTGTTNTGAPATGSTTFDPKTATKVAAGVEPKQHVENYLKACAAGDFTTAFKMLPADKQASYGTADAYAGQLKGYGDLSNYSVSEPKKQGEDVVVTGSQNIGGMEFAYDWTFVKSDGGWLVKSRNQAQ